MKNKVLIFSLIVGLFFSLTSCGSEEEFGLITGSVHLMGATDHSDATVYIVGTNISTVTSESGIFSLYNVPAGSHMVKAEKEGYQSTTSDIVEITKSQSVQILDLELLNLSPPDLPDE